MAGSRYKLLGSSLGKGSYGTVSPAWDLKEERLVAIKKQEGSSDEAVREMMLFDMLPPHPNRLRMYDKFCGSAHLYIVFEYMILSLRQVWERAQGFLNFKMVGQYGREVLNGLAHLHGHRVAHRDLSMNNVLLGENGSGLKIADLGLACSCESFILERTVQTLPYRAPEVLLQGKEPARLPNAPCTLDMWSFGVICYQLWASELPFSGTDVRCILQGQIDLLGPPTRSAGVSAADLDAQAVVADSAEAAGFDGAASLQSDAPEAYLPKWGETAATLRCQAPEHPFPGSLRLARRPVSEETVRDFLAKLLVWNPAERLASADALRHPMFQAGTSNPPGSPGEVPRSAPAALSNPQEAAGYAGVVADFAAMAAAGVSAATPPEAEASALMLETGESAGVVADAKAMGAAGVSAAAPSEGEASALMPVGASSLCRCTGNCGTLACGRAKRALYRPKSGSQSTPGTSDKSKHLCERRRLPGFISCKHCKCEVEACVKFRRQALTTGRFCSYHNTALASNAKNYGNPAGIWKFGKSWSQELRLVASNSALLREIPPCDVEAFVAAALPRMQGNALAGQTLLKLWAAAYIVFPWAIRAWVDAVFDPAFPAQPKVSDYAKLLAMLSLAEETDSPPGDPDAKQRAWEAAQLASRRKLWGPLALSRMMESRECRKRKRDNDDKQSCWGELIEVAEKTSPITCPTSPDGCAVFAGELQAFLQRFPVEFNHGTAGSPKSQTAYVCKSIQRKFFLRRRKQRRRFGIL